MRGGYFELLGFSPEVKQEIYKLSSISLCSNTIGQIATGIMVQPPKAGDASFALYEQERGNIINSLKRRADKLSAFLDKLPGVTCNSIEGAMYAFPCITLPGIVSKYALLRTYCHSPISSSPVRQSCCCSTRKKAGA